MKIPISLFLTLYIPFLVVAHPFQSNLASHLIEEDKAATAISKVTLYPDSSFLSHSNTAYPPGTLFEVLGQSVREHEDNLQNQKFKWYEVKATDGRIGWVFGDGLAVILSENDIAPILQPFHKKKQHFNNGFEQSTVWIAGLEGKDNFHQQDYLNPIYKELYIVITNRLNRSVHINYAGESARGEVRAESIDFKDITGDKTAEIIVQQKLTSPSLPLVERTLSVYNFQAGTLVKTLEERLSLTSNIHRRSPALYKFVEIGQQSIRVAYMDYMDCKKYKQPNAHSALSSGQEFCLEYVTYTYFWEERTKKYELLYGESRTVPKGKIKKTASFLLEQPFANASPIDAMPQGTSLHLIKDCATVTMKNGQQEKQHYFYVRLKTGETGFVPANAIDFGGIEHATLLEQFYAAPPKNLLNWKTDIVFLSFVD